MDETTSRTEPPALVITGPACPLCEDEVSCDSTSYWCENCDVQWDLDGADAEWSEPHAEQCPWLYDTSALGAVRCVLAIGHGPRHASDVTGWSWTEENRKAHLPLAPDKS